MKWLLGGFGAVVIGGLALLLWWNYPVPCVSTDLLRLSLNGIEYHVPTVLQPRFSPPEVVPTVDHFPNGMRATKYCQRLSDSPAAVTSISFPKANLVSLARIRPDLGDLADILPLAIDRSFGSDRAPPAKAQPTPDGLFLRMDKGDRFELFSTKPLLFNSKITADCGPAGTPYPSNACHIWGRMYDGSLLKIGVLDTDKPIDTWPRMLQQVQTFISSLITKLN